MQRTKIKIRFTIWILAFVSFLWLSSGMMLAHAGPSGAAIYKKNCATCHGATGKGDGIAGKSLNPKPANYTKGVFKKGCTPSQLEGSIGDGIKGSAMPSWKKLLKHDEIKAVAAYILQTFVPKKIVEEKCTGK